MIDQAGEAGREGPSANDHVSRGHRLGPVVAVQVRYTGDDSGETASVPASTAAAGRNSGCQRTWPSCGGVHERRGKYLRRHLGALFPLTGRE